MPERIAVVVGTRPEIIKMAEVVILLRQRAMLIHTGQHWDHEMSGTFLEQLDLPDPDVTLAIGGGTRTQQIAKTMQGLEAAFSADRPAALMVQGDTNTVVGASLVANAMSIPLVHVEAGLRSFDRLMPEEHNRVIADHLADLCLAPTQNNRQLLLAEGVPDERIAVTGNTIVAAVIAALEHTTGSATELLESHGLIEGEFVVSTIHRPENTDTPSALELLFSSLNEIAAQAAPVLVPLHPRTRRRLDDFGLSHLLDPLNVVGPLGYDQFVALAARAALVVSDSGGIQEEASVWKRPVVVVRRSTERPEGLGTFSYLTSPGQELVRTTTDVYRRRDEIRSQLEILPSPYGDSSAAARCITAVEGLLEH